jgi:glycosyltransferase involved in cell wall biosynthesis
MKSKISVVITAYNEEKYIGRCIEALKHQTLPRNAFELIIIDNNSKDNTVAIIHKMGEKSISYTKHQGTVFPKDYGIRLANTEIVVLTDADVIPQPEWLETIAAIMEKDNYLCIGGTVLSTQDAPVVNFIFTFFDYFAAFLQLLGFPLLWGSNMAFKKKTYLEVGGFNTTLKTSEDWDLAMRIQKKFGMHSVKYFRGFPVKTSPRKQESLQKFASYISIGVMNFITLFILRKSKTYGSYKFIR